VSLQQQQQTGGQRTAQELGGKRAWVSFLKELKGTWTVLSHAVMVGGRADYHISETKMQGNVNIR
jgi:hypothetical protein